MEAGIAPHFKVIDDRTSAELKTEARNCLMADIEIKNHPAKKAFGHLAGLIDEAGLIKIMNF